MIMLTKQTFLFSLITVLITLSPSFLSAEESGRLILPSCQSFLIEEQIFSLADESAEASWNKHYKDGHNATRRGDYNQAEREMCLALKQAQNFDARDWRFAETLDELGLIYFMQEQYGEAEKAQGAAVAELLLAAGPTTMRETRTRKVSMFIQRLGRVYSKQDRNDLTTKILDYPYKIYQQEYIPLDLNLIKRLGWLVSEYLGAENLTASNDLLNLIDEIKSRDN